ncbi:hypothetical protein LBMAG34_4780 [Candidatus Saccharibacteria bacterium]|nr:hypothetical protein LBMAG34_4780 [Candidatus Saccharibacteria bacterium]
MPPQMNPNQQEYINSTTPPKKKKGDMQSTQAHLNFSEVRDGIVIMRDGSLRMIVMCSPTNYDLKSSAEKDAIEFAYQGFLNGLHFPIQICVQSRKIDLDSYLDDLDHKLADQTNPLLAGLMEDYIFNIRDLLTQVNIMDKRFYVVVPYFVAEAAKGNVFKELAGTVAPQSDVSQTSKEFQDRKAELIQRTNSVAQGLASIGVRAAVLRTQEVIELFYGSYNIDESEHQSLGNAQDLVAPVTVRSGSPARPYQPQTKEPEPQDLFSAAQKNTTNNTQAQPQQVQPQYKPGGTK